MNIHYQLAILKKGNSSIADYFHKFTHLTNTLAAIDQPLPHHEALSFLLASFGSDYDSLVTSIKTQLHPMSLEDLYGHMLNHELCLAQNQPTADLSNVSANFTNKGPSNHGGLWWPSLIQLLFQSWRKIQFEQPTWTRACLQSNNQSPFETTLYSLPKSLDVPVGKPLQFQPSTLFPPIYSFVSISENSYTPESTPQMQALFATPNHS
uniref:Uncharacterized protein n=1 Tax=Fagus sylvatica TaxID=28930 RepID=A0A2N9HEV4_FAGSY